MVRCAPRKYSINTLEPCTVYALQAWPSVSCAQLQCRYVDLVPAEADKEDHSEAVVRKQFEMLQPLTCLRCGRL